jgi:hypothetical protein
MPALDIEQTDLDDELHGQPQIRCYLHDTV